MTVYTAGYNMIELDANPLATAGGEGTVFKIIKSSTYPNHCAKIFHDGKRTPAKKNKIAFLIANKPAKLSTPSYHFCWPQEIVYDASDKFVGFIMPLALPNSEKLYELAGLNLNQKLGNTWQTKYNRHSADGLSNRIKACTNLAIAVHVIHLTRLYAMVDLKPQNILITPDGKISVTDIDSFQASGGFSIHHPGDVVTAEYAPAEFHKSLNPGKNVVHSWDHFSLAVTFYQLLLGLHPFAATTSDQHSVADTLSDKIKCGLFVHGSKKIHLSVIPPPHEMFNKLPAAIKKLFMEAFETGHSNAAGRPSAAVWGATLFEQARRAAI